MDPELVQQQREAEIEAEQKMAKPGPEPFTPATVAQTIIAFLGIEPNEKHACEHGCKHSAFEYIEAQLRQMLEHAR